MKKYNLLKQDLYRDYIINELSCAEIGRKYNITNVTIWNYLKKYNITLRTGSQSIKLLYKKDPMRRNGEKNPVYGQRWGKKYNCKNCGIRVSFNSVHYGNGRCQSCEMKRRHQKGIIDNKNINNPSYKHGFFTRDKLSIYYLIKRLDNYGEWRKKIYRRDNYICQLCKKNYSGKLHAHHKKEFIIILQEFLKIYSQFSLIEDKETLVRLAITYQPFWDINNGITLCKDCHKEYHGRKKYVK